MRSDVAAGRLESLTLGNSRPLARLITARDIPGEGFIGPLARDEVVLPRHEIRYRGQVLALLAVPHGSSDQSARRDLRVATTAAPAAYRPVLMEDLGGDYLESHTLARQSLGNSRATAEAMASAAHWVSGRYHFPPVRHAYLRPDSCVSAWKGDHLVVWTACHAPFELRHQVADMLACEPDAVTIRGGPSGGSFGGLLDPLLPCLAALAAFVLRSSVSIAITPTEHRMFGPHSNGIGADLVLGCDPDGRLVALRLSTRVDAGAYSSYGGGVLRRILAHAAGPYHVRSVYAEGTLVWTNDRPASAFRGFGVGPLTVMLEDSIERLARQTGIDPIKLRRCNVARPGQKLGNGQTVGPSLEIARSLERCAEARDRLLADATRETRDATSAVGLALFLYGIGNTGQRNPAAARVEYVGHGRVRLYTSTSDMGQGSHKALRAICAREFRIGLRDIELVRGDTTSLPDSGKTSASRTVHFVGNAVVRAIRDLLDGAAKAVRVAGAWDEVEWTPSGTLLCGSSGRRDVLTLDQIRDLLGRDLGGMGRYDPEISEELGIHYPVYAAGGHVVRIQVDRQTGGITLEAVVAVHDLGLIVDHKAAEAQVHGGAAMAASAALVGGADAAQAVTFLRSSALPAIQVELLGDERDIATTPGLGEPAAIATASAIFNAWQATGGDCPVGASLHPLHAWRLKSNRTGETPSAAVGDGATTATWRERPCGL
ncbi:MAG: aldehyde oxidoreductase [Solirubrobacteraceae bacterium]|nr:aldehyde oxidoreductase [Solirubrobacteraceae bacterium]